MEMLELLHKSWETCTRCRLSETRTKLVFGSGSPTAKVVLIGEAPGATEDATGVPFCGISGILLDKAIKRAGLIRRELFITNTLCCRPPGNRNPEHDEQDACYQRLLNTIDIIQPKVLLLVGKPSAQFILGREVYVTKERGTTGKVVLAERELDYVIMLHPSYVKRQGTAVEPRYIEEMSGDIKLAWDIAERRSQQEG